MIVPELVQERAAPYHVPLMQTLLDRVDPGGKRVLEIGSDYHLISARLLRANGASEVVATNLSEWRSPDPLPEGIRFEVVDASLTDFPDSSFDLIYGIAVLEHIPDLPRMCREIRRMLRRGGKAFLQGHPFWSSSFGHHVWYLRKDGTRYMFHEANNPIIDWSHLVLPPDELASELRSRGVPREDAGQIVNFVFNLDGKESGRASNHLLPSEVLACLARHFEMTIVSRDHDASPENEYYALASREYGEGDLKTKGFCVLMER